MNERLQEIYKQATGQDWSCDFDTFIAEEFAALVARETFDWISANCGYMDESTWRDFQRHLGITFGVTFAGEIKMDGRERLAQPEQEPVAWRWKERINGDFDNWVVTFSEPPPYAVEQQPLYTAPPKREWVGLTDEELSAIYWKPNETLDEYGRNIEAKCKEKNT